MNKKKNRLIVSFSGQGMNPLQTPQKEFLRTLSWLFPEDSKLFFLDDKNAFYHRGIAGLSNDILSTVSYLEDKIKGFDEVVFLGSSAGGYASILFGSILKIQKVIAFIPQTNIKGYSSKTLAEYEDLNVLINNITKYYLFGCMSQNYKSWHGKMHLDNVKKHHNVAIKFFKKLSLKELRDSGELHRILSSIIYS